MAPSASEAAACRTMMVGMENTAPGVGEVKAMAGAALVAVAVTGVDSADSSRRSVARAIKTWEPSGALDQLKLNGAVQSSPNLRPSAKNSTLKTAPSGSWALTLIPRGVNALNELAGLGVAMEM